MSIKDRADDIVNRVVANLVTAGALVALGGTAGVGTIVGIALWARLSELSAAVVTALALASAALTLALLNLAVTIKNSWGLHSPKELEELAYADEHGYVCLGNRFSIRAHKGKRQRDAEDRWSIELALTVRNDERSSAHEAELRLIRVDALANLPDGPDYRPIESLQPGRLQWSAGDSGGTKCSFQHEALAIIAHLKAWGDSHRARTQIRIADQSLWDQYLVPDSSLHLVIDLAAEGRRAARFVVSMSVPALLTSFRGKNEPTVYFKYEAWATAKERSSH